MKNRVQRKYKAVRKNRTDKKKFLMFEKNTHFRGRIGLVIFF